MTDIPWDKLGVPFHLREQAGPDAPPAARLAAARGLLPATRDVQLALLYVSAATGDAMLRDAAVTTLRGFPELASAISSRTHSKVLEFVAEFRPEPEVDALLAHHRNLNDRTAVLIAGRAGALLAESMCDDHERLLITPEVLVALHANPATGHAPLERAISFLRMERALPPLPEVRGQGAAPARAAAAPTPEPAAFDLDAEIEAALAGKPSPALQARQKLALFDLDKHAGGPATGFQFNFQSDDDFALDLLDDGQGEAAPEVRLSIEKRIAAMPPGKKIKLAYLGNKETRNILIRDRNKQVALAVVKSGRMTENEALNAAGNRNLAMDVLREISANREFMRKYPVKVALVNNPRTPPSVAVPIVAQLQKRDLESLARNRNVSSVLFSMAEKMVRQKSQNQGKEGK